CVKYDYSYFFDYW
nr:immunoglobulin heavy chain junction region [Mus musculus]MBK4187191.1 immunoglobulin heavy chain junction region [Mus musculus]